MGNIILELSSREMAYLLISGVHRWVWTCGRSGVLAQASRLTIKLLNPLPKKAVDSLIVEIYNVGAAKFLATQV